MKGWARRLASKAVQTDDTPVPVLDPELPRTRTGRIWTYVGQEKHPYTVYDYTPNRSRDGPDAFLQKFRGYLQADAYSGYDHLYEELEHGVVEVACWAHYPDSGFIQSLARGILVDVPGTGVATAVRSR